MQILSIQLKNIKSHRDTDLTFSPGINVLSGANGVGKSTIFEAVGYVLFGVDAQSFVGKIERFISIGAKRGEIALVFQLTNGEKYRVSRSVGSPSKWLLAKELGGSFEVEEHKDAKETEARLKELLGLKSGRSLAEQFELVIGPFQHDFLGPFVIKQPAKRRDKFDEILGIDTWRKTFTKTNDLLKAINGKVDVLQSAIGPLKDQVALLPEKRIELKAAKQGLELTQNELQKKQRILADLETRLGAADQREQALRALGVEIEKLKERISNGTEKIAEQKSMISAAERAAKIIVETAAGKLAFEQAEAYLTELRGQVRLQRHLEQEVAGLDKQVSKVSERFAVESANIEKARDELRGEERSLEDNRKMLAVDEGLQQLAGSLPEIRIVLDGLRKRLGQLEGRRAGLEEGNEKLGEGICPFFQEPCLNIAEKPPQDIFSAKFNELENERQILEAEFKKVEQQELSTSQASDRIKEVEIKLKGLEQQGEQLALKSRSNDARAQGLQGLQVEQSALQTQLTEKQQALKTYSQLQADIDMAEAEKRKYQQVRDLYVENQRQAAELEQRKAELQKFEQLFKQLQEELIAKETGHSQASKEYDAAQHELMRRQKDGLGREVGALGQKIEGLGADMARLTADIDKLKLVEQDIAAKQARIKVYDEKRDLVSFLRNRVFRNVSGALSERFREEISQRANRIYRVIAEVDEELCWGEDYRILLRDMADGEIRERTDDQLSGGQTMSAVVALRLAMLQTIGARIAFFDEPTSNLDATRRENLARAFRSIDVGKEEVTEHWYDQLFLISHDVAFSEITDQIVHLDKPTLS